MYADLYDRHAARLLAELAARTRNSRLAAELCAETFAVALLDAQRSDITSERLAAIAEHELAQAERTGAASDRVRRRLGIPPLEPGERFLADLEEELDAAARFLATRRKPLPRPRLPASMRSLAPRLRAPKWPAALRRLPRRAALAGAAALALAAVVAAFALGGGDGDQQPPATFGATARLVPMVERPRCFAHIVRKRRAAPVLPYFSVFNRRPRLDDKLGPDMGESLPIATYHPAEPRLAADGRRGTRLHLVPSLGVSTDRGCAADDGPGLCLYEDSTGRYSCFGIERIRDALAFARTARGSVVGIVPDGIGTVTLNAGGRRASARVEGNVYEAELRVAPGTPVGVVVTRAGPPGCEREAAPGLLAAVAALRRPPTDRLLPMAALSELRDYPEVADVVERGARFWGAEDGVEFWVVPIAERGSHACDPARGACVVAVPRVADPEAACAYSPHDVEDGYWEMSPLLRERGAVYGLVPDEIAGGRVTFGARSEEVPARDNVIAGLFSFPYEDPLFLDLTRRPAPSLPRVGIVDAGGGPGAIVRRLERAGYDPLRAIIPADDPQRRTVVHWHPRRATFAEAAAVARAIDAAELIRIRGEARTPRAVLHAAGPVVVVVGAVTAARAPAE
jgi:hypothetical protein